MIRFSFLTKLFAHLFFICILPVSQAQSLATAAKTAIVVDITNKAILYEKDADKLFPPASMSKIMTAYVVFDLLKSGKISLETKFYVPQVAYDVGGVQTGSSSMRLNPGQRVSVHDLLKGLLTVSGNDAAITLAVSISGTEEKFAELMTATAKRLGLNSTFGNASGLSDPKQSMSARDLALLTQRIIENHSEFFYLFGIKEMTFNGVAQTNRNWLIQNRSDVDGMKTGYTSEAGYCITATAKRNGRRLVVVVSGLSSADERIREAEKLLDWGFENYTWNWLFARNQKLLSVPVWKGKPDMVDLLVSSDVHLFLEKNELDKLEAFATYETVNPPVKQGDTLGHVVIRNKEEGQAVLSVPLIASRDIEKLNMWENINFHWQSFLKYRNMSSGEQYEHS